MLNERSAINKIKLKFEEIDRVVIFPIQGGSFFSPRMTGEGIIVDNLGFYPLLPWTVFVELINFLIKNGSRAEKGFSTDARLGDEGLSLETMEGHIAHVVYSKKVGTLFSGACHRSRPFWSGPAFVWRQTMN